MDTYSSTDAKREFGEVLIKSQRGPVSVTRNGKPIAVVLSDVEYRELKLQAVRAALIEGEESGDAGEFDAAALKARARSEAGLSPDAENS